MRQQLRYRDRDSWLGARGRHVVTATETPVIIQGKDRFGKTRDQLFLKKLGKLGSPNLTRNKHVQFGSRAEWFLEDKAQREYPELGLCNPGPFTIQYNPQYPWLQCTVDLFDIYGNGIVELKTGTPKTWAKGPPREYEWQVRHQMVVTGCERGILIVMLADSSIKDMWESIPKSYAQADYWARNRDNSGLEVLHALEECQLEVFEVGCTDEHVDTVLRETKQFVEELEDMEEVSSEPV